MALVTIMCRCGTASDVNQLGETHVECPGCGRRFKALLTPDRGKPPSVERPVYGHERLSHYVGNVDPTNRDAVREALERHNLFGERAVEAAIADAILKGKR